jgi:hypothetical protein
LPTKIYLHSNGKTKPPSCLRKLLYGTYNMYIAKKVCSEKQKVVAVCHFSSPSFLETVRQFSFPSFCDYMEPEDFCYCLLIITSCQIHSSSTFVVWLNNLQYCLLPEQSILYTVLYSVLHLKKNFVNDYIFRKLSVSAHTCTAEAV